MTCVDGLRETHTSIYCSLLTQPKSSYEGTPDTEEDRPGCAMPAHSQPSVHESAPKHSSLHGTDRASPHTHLRPIQEKAKLRRCRDAILTHNCRTHPDAKIDPDKRDLLPLRLRLCSRELLKHCSIILHAGHVADVNITTTARCEPSRLRNDAGFVDRWMTVVVVGLPLLPRVVLLRSRARACRSPSRVLWRERRRLVGGRVRRGNRPSWLGAGLLVGWNCGRTWRLC